MRPLMGRWLCDRCDRMRRGVKASSDGRGVFCQDCIGEVEQAIAASREHVELVKYPWGDSWECSAGQGEEPIGCERHSTHYRCSTCEGWFGVPHDGIHTGRNKHPDWSSVQSGCVCRPCKAERERMATLRRGK